MSAVSCTHNDSDIVIITDIEMFLKMKKKLGRYLLK